MGFINHKKVDVVCAQYHGRTEQMQLSYCCDASGKDIYVTAGCDFFSPCENCQKCVAVVVRMFNQGFEEMPGKPIVPSLQDG